MAHSTTGMFTGTNAHFLEEMLQQYLKDPSSLDPSWHHFFEHEGAELLAEGSPTPAPTFATRSIFAGPLAADVSENNDAAIAQVRITELINSYRRHGHLKARLDPLGIRNQTAHRMLAPSFWGLGPEHLDVEFSTASLRGPKSMTMRELVVFLEETYARTIGAEYMHLSNQEELEWLQERCESTRNHCDFDVDTQRYILNRLCTAEAFESFLHVKFSGAKRFSLEGAESMVPLLALLIEQSAKQGVEEIILGMPHRGRLNVLANIFQKNCSLIFGEFADTTPESFMGRGDVKYHMGYSANLSTRYGDKVHLSMAFNPSHLEAVNPVVSGRVRAKQDRMGEGGQKKVLPILLHGDAAFPGQGLVSETLNLMNLKGYTTGGTIHIIVNNQIGFTTNPRDSRSTTYCTDIAKMIEVPIFHVNGEDPEAVAHVSQIAAEYRQRFHKDFIIDMYCFRKYGHNETDEPKFTQPLMYQHIKKHPPVHQVYVEQLKGQGNIDANTSKQIIKEKKASFNRELKAMREGKRPAEHGAVPFLGIWSQYCGGPDADTFCPPTNITVEAFHTLLGKMGHIPENFHPHPRIADILHARAAMGREERPLDWGAGESLAFASLLTAGHPVRVSGQDCQRGTFSHRHAVLSDQVDDSTYSPLEDIAADSGTRFEAINSPLSEAAVLGFEFGYALDTPEGLTIWEAQFGDFANGAQVIIDQFISSCEDKWERLNGLVLLLPHGYEGQGPEHSSARLGRFLQLCAEDNMQVCNLSTPAQIFHILRRQVIRKWRKPLVIMTPKSLLRHKLAVSSIEDFTEGSFQRVIPEGHLANPEVCTRAVVCSGKIYYELLEQRQKLQDSTTAIIRLEQIHPFPKAQLQAALDQHPNLTEFVWCQEEPENMGAFYFLFPRLTKMLSGIALRWETREASASPATGSKKAHLIEQQDLLDRVFQIK